MTGTGEAVSHSSGYDCPCEDLNADPHKGFNDFILCSTRYSGLW
jgi:hypothetical protein